jgi:hypothetical protein
MLRALKTELVESDGLACLSGMPFSGLVFDARNTGGAVRVTFQEDTLTCQRVLGVESYSDGRPGGDSALLDIELPYIHAPMAAFDGFPDCAQDLDATLDNGSAFSGAIYVPSAKDGWEARLYTAGNQDIRLWWHPNGRLARASSGIPVDEEYSWYKDGSWERCCISPSPHEPLCLAIAPDHRVTLLILNDWKAAVFAPGRRMSFQYIDKFDDLLKLHSANDIMLAVDRDCIEEMPKIIASGFLDDAVIIKWNGSIFGDAVITLFETLSKKKLKAVSLQSYCDSSKDFAVALAEKLPELKVTSWALNKARRGQ